MKTTIVIGDSHTSRLESNDRFRWLGKMISHRKPDHVVQIGDFLTFDSITHWNFGKPLLAEGRRLMDDINCGIEALDTLMTPISRLQARQAKSKKRIYSPKLSWLLGNHDARLLSYYEKNPETIGLLSHLGPSFVGAGSLGWEVVPYGGYADFCGVGFTHIPFNRLGKPIGGEHIAYQSVAGEQRTVVFGHTHRRQMHSIPVRGEVGYKDGISAGCYFNHTPEYLSSPEKSDWWRGILILHHLDEEGHVDCEWINIQRIEDEYS